MLRAISALGDEFIAQLLEARALGLAKLRIIRRLWPGVWSGGGLHASIVPAVWHLGGCDEAMTVELRVGSPP